MSAPLAFLDFVRGECAYAGVRLDLVPKARTRAGDLGSFDGETRVLRVCVGAPDWLCLLAHETAHLRQWRERPAFFDAADVDAFEGWCEGRRRLKPHRLLEITRAIQRLELDAERRAVRLIRKFRLTDDVASYARGACLYVWNYEVARRIGRWPRYGARLDEVRAAMPVRLIPQTLVGKPPALLEEAAAAA